MNEINEKLIQENRTDRNEEPFIKEKAQKAPYMGYAYAKKIEKPQLMFGNSPEDILKTLNQWNQGRKEGYTYDTCNIGAYNPELDKYENYSKYDVQTGKNVTKIYLQVPKGMSKEEFDQTRQYLKENGARFSNLKKQWYITPDIRDKFEKYLEVSEDKRSEAEKLKEAETQKNTKKLPDKKPLQTEKVFLQMPRGMSKEEFDQTRQYLKENGASFDRERKQWYVAPENQEKFEKYLGNPEEKETVKVELLPEAPTGKEKESYIGYIQKVIPQQYTVQLADGESICVRPEKLFEFAAIQNLNPQYVVQLTNGEDLYVRQEKEFEKLIDLLNDAEKKVAEHIEKTWQTAREEGWDMENYQKQFLSGTVWSEKIGEKIDLYLPEYSLSEKGFREITDVQMVSGKLLYADMEKGVYVINGKTGTQVVEGIVYDEKQADIVNKALERNMPAVEIDLIGDSHLSAAQMQQVYESLVTERLPGCGICESGLAGLADESVPARHVQRACV